MSRTLSSAARQPPPEKEDDPVTVLVTGFRPFLQKFPKNTSWEIASTLPALLPSSPSSPTPIHIHVHHEPVRVTYSHVVSFIPQLLAPANSITPRPDIILHIGLAADQSFYTLEKGAQGRGYGAIPDVDGGRFGDERMEEMFPKGMFPQVLETSLDVEDVLRRWRRGVGYENPDEEIGVQDEKTKTPDVRNSPDAGNFMCGFTYYNSLAHYFSIKKDERPVVFLHVPDLSDSDEKLAVGREVTIALIKAVVESRRKKGVVDGVPRVADGGEDGDVKAGTDVNFAEH
ncbi:peptidase C15, pyroglutamyl peptidase I-like protein [Lindgomyces ingoldianus]|uniref:Peptidase C15, pyroglutamyl peptidase I-like protein n=1 Tax=Lindgomyces ingoldianus TaxID=673940 RepID=A0ACB6QK80_9PLEO|nr:peptidase C15, pyroglutamyl peptidase I-like protein [Lindgomyces ingoldianus]KAF2466522.1 peptidase C15, pyroglutamyl peptidase I-like protein [Lindgomyces ingoldianus]